MTAHVPVKRIFFLWIISFALGLSVYWLLYWILGRHVYGTWYRMFNYHYDYPEQYMLIPCFFFGIIGSAFLRRFALKRTTLGRLGITFIVIVLTVLVSSPFGGMLWVFHHMAAGRFPPDAFEKIIVEGSVLGLELCWLIVLLSAPYNLIGSVVCYFLLKAAAGKFEFGAC